MIFVNPFFVYLTIFLWHFYSPLANLNNLSGKSYLKC